MGRCHYPSNDRLKFIPEYKFHVCIPLYVILTSYCMGTMIELILNKTQRQLCILGRFKPTMICLWTWSQRTRILTVVCSAVTDPVVKVLPPLLWHPLGGVNSLYLPFCCCSSLPLWERSCLNVELSPTVSFVDQSENLYSGIKGNTGFHPGVHCV